MNISSLPPGAKPIWSPAEGRATVADARGLAVPVDPAKALAADLRAELDWMLGGDR